MRSRCRVKGYNKPVKGYDLMGTYNLMEKKDVNNRRVWMMEANSSKNTPKMYLHFRSKSDGDGYWTIAPKTKAVAAEEVAAEDVVAEDLASEGEVTNTKVQAEATETEKADISDNQELIKLKYDLSDEKFKWMVWVEQKEWVHAPELKVSGLIFTELEYFSED